MKDIYVKPNIRTQESWRGEFLVNYLNDEQWM